MLTQWFTALHYEQFTCFGCPCGPVLQGRRCGIKSSTYGEVKLLGACRVSAMGIAVPESPSWYLEEILHYYTSVPAWFPSETVGFSYNSHFRSLQPFSPGSVSNWTVGPLLLDNQILPSGPIPVELKRCICAPGPHHIPGEALTHWQKAFSKAKEKNLHLKNHAITIGLLNAFIKTISSKLFSCFYNPLLEMSRICDDILKRHLSKKKKKRSSSISSHEDRTKQPAVAPRSFPILNIFVGKSKH